MHEKIKSNLALLICSVFEKNSQPQNNYDVYKTLVEPPNADLADLAFGCFLIAKNLKKSPAVVAQELVESLNQLQLKDHGIDSIVAAGPYVNFKFTSTFCYENVIYDILSGEYFKRKLIEESQIQKVMVEFSQPNTHKELHVGHMRNLCLGDSLVRLMRRSYEKDNIISSTFPGDVGTHVAKCLWFINNHVSADEYQKQKNSDHRGEWLGRMYSSGNLKLEDEAQNPELFEKNKRQLTEILKQLESHSGEYFEMWKETRQWSIDLMKKVYEWAHVEFDRWYWESEVDAPSVKTIKKYYSEGLLQESQGAIGLDLESENLGFCLLLKSDGTGLYATKDIELARRKFEDFKIQKSIYVVDMRQALHFKQVFRTLDHLGFKQAKDCYHLQYNFVELPDGAMSSRKGNIVPLMDLVNNMKAHVKNEYLQRYVNEWSSEEIDLVADQVAQGAIKYGMLKQDTNKKIVFDMKEWLKLDGESGPFIQYSYARINSLIKKIPIDSSKALDGDLLTHESERKLMLHLSNLNTVILSAAESYKPALLCSYLYDTAKKFNTFYHECSISQASSLELQQARLSLAVATGNIIKYGLAELGIPVPDRM